MAKKTFSK